MSGAKDPYVKVYYGIADDPRFGQVFESDAALATWLRLLIIADGAWPASAHLPASCKPRALRTLVEAGLVELTGHRFRIHGMDAERSKRADHASRASRERWSSNPPSNAPSNAQTMPLNSEQNRTTQNSSTQANGQAPKEEKPWVSLTAQEKAEHDRREKDEAIRLQMLRVGLKPEPVA